MKSLIKVSLWIALVVFYGLALASSVHAVEPIDFSKPLAMIVSGRPAPGCSASYGSELNTTQNASAPAGITEQGNTDSWTNSGCVTFDHNGTAQSGSYAVQCVADGANDKASYALPALSAATLYRLSFYYRHNGTGGAWSIFTGAAAGYSTNKIVPTTTTTDYTNHTLFFLTNAVSLAGMTHLVASEESATDDGGIYIDSISVKAATLCFGSELHDDANAASLASEADATTSFTSVGSGTLASSNADPADGTYHLTFTATANEDRFYKDLLTDFSLEDGKKYMFRFKAKYISGDVAYCQLSYGTTSGGYTYQFSITSGVSSYVEYGASFVYSTATSAFRYFKCVEGGVANNASFKIDSLSVKEITAE